MIRSNTGHGHVWPRPDGMKARCGGPGICSVCSTDAARLVPKVESPPLAPTVFKCNCPHEVRSGCSRPICPYYVAPRIPALPRVLIAFTGLAGSGKSTAAAHLVNRHGFQRVRFAGPLKSMMAALGCSPEQIDGSEKEKPCELLGGKTPRWAMQSLGTEWGRDLITPDLWIRAFNAALAKVPAGTPVVVDDCRFPNEAEAVRAAGGVVVRIERPGAGAGAAGHSSEGQQLDAVTTLCNTADTQFLFTHLDRLIADLSWRETNAPA